MQPGLRTINLGHSLPTLTDSYFISSLQSSHFQYFLSLLHKQKQSLGKSHHHLPMLTHLFDLSLYMLLSFLGILLVFFIKLSPPPILHSHPLTLQQYLALEIFFLFLHHQFSVSSESFLLAYKQHNFSLLKTKPNKHNFALEYTSLPRFLQLFFTCLYSSHSGLIVS